MSTGAVKITLHSANNDVDEKAEVTVALKNPEQAVEKMLRTLAQRFPPESVVTISPGSMNASAAASEASSAEKNEKMASYYPRIRSREGKNSDVDQFAGLDPNMYYPGAPNQSMVPGLVPADSPHAFNNMVRMRDASSPAKSTATRLPSISDGGQKESFGGSQDARMRGAGAYPSRTDYAGRGGPEYPLDSRRIDGGSDYIRGDPGVRDYPRAAGDYPRAAGGYPRGATDYPQAGRDYVVPAGANASREGAGGAGSRDGMYGGRPSQYPGDTRGGEYGRSEYPQRSGDYSRLKGEPDGTNYDGGAGAPTRYADGASYPAGRRYGDASAPANYGDSRYRGAQPGRYPSAGGAGDAGSQREGSGAYAYYPTKAESGVHRDPNELIYEHQPRGATSSDECRAMVVNGGGGKLRPGFGEYVETLPDGSRVRYVEVEVHEERVHEIPKVEVREVIKEEVETRIETREKVVEVPEIVEEVRYVEVEQEEERIVNKPVKEVREVPVEIVREVFVDIPRQREERVEVPEYIEVEKPYEVEQKVTVTNYVEKRMPCVVAQKLKPTISESSQTLRVDTNTYEPVLYAVDVYIPKPIENGILMGHSVLEEHREVAIPAPQFNTLATKMNPHLQHDALQHLYMKTVEGHVPMLPAGEIAEIVSPLPGSWTDPKAPNDSASKPRAHRHHHHGRARPGRSSQARTHHTATTQLAH